MELVYWIKKTQLRMEKISEKQEKWVNYLNTKSELHIISAGTDIKVGIKIVHGLIQMAKSIFPMGKFLLLLSNRY